MRVFLGEHNYDVLDSGVVVGLKGQRITVEVDKKSQFFVYFDFGNEHPSMGGNAQPNVTARGVGKNGLSLLFEGYANSHGHGSIEPLQVGSFDNRVLYLNYRIFAYPKKSYATNFSQGGVTLMYTWFLGEYAKNN